MKDRQAAGSGSALQAAARAMVETASPRGMLRGQWTKGLAAVCAASGMTGAWAQAQEPRADATLATVVVTAAGSA
ncbi:exported protein of unknown function (plasmid) [Cupriavidus taiwanensis]|uniref:Uncharacterized protein n=1 Tax=Cupriavidus taiwanensis TaxID=164546 RepID=A0A375IQ96_9BURK|nr:exported protein of unknown function [Cupriavidus taiwanensis]